MACPSGQSSPQGAKTGCSACATNYFAAAGAPSCTSCLVQGVAACGPATAAATSW